MDKPTQPRFRSEAQLARKRSLDRAHHHAKRIRSKTQLDAVQQDISEIRESVRFLADEMYRLSHAFQSRCMPPTAFSPAQPAAPSVEHLTEASIMVEETQNLPAPLNGNGCRSHKASSTLVCS